MNKPITLLKEEFVNQLTDLINNSGLAPIILEPIFKEVYGNIGRMYKSQLEADRERYYSSLQQQQEVGENEIHDESVIRETDGED